jgi:hypothetical protein
MNNALPLKVKFKNDEEPIEIFCPQKFKDYYLRGQLIEISGNIYDKTPRDGLEPPTKWLTATRSAD